MKTTKLGKTAILTLVMGAFLIALFGCQKQEGPAERAGKEIDKATEKVGRQVEKAGDKMQDVSKGSQQ